MRTIQQLSDAIDAVVATDERLSFQLTMEELNAILAEVSGALNDIEITTIQQGAPQANEIQLIRLYGTFSGGTFTLTFSGQTTAGIAPTANAADVKTALEALSNIATDDLIVTGTLSGGLTIEFAGTLANTNVAQLMIDVSGLTGASLHADPSTTTEGVLGVTVTMLQEGTAATDEVQILSLLDTFTGGTFTLAFDGQTTAAITYNADAATVQAALEALSNLAPGDVICTGGPFPGTPITVTFGGTLAATNVPQITLNPSNLTGGAIDATITTTTEGAGETGSKQFAIIGATNPGTDTTGGATLYGSAPYATSGTFALTWNGLTTSAIAWDATFSEIRDALNTALSSGLAVFLSYIDGNRPPDQAYFKMTGPGSNSTPTVSIDNTNLVGGVYFFTATAPDGTYHAEAAITGTYKLDVSNGVVGGNTTNIDAGASPDTVRTRIQEVLDNVIGSGTVSVARLNSTSALSGIAGGYVATFSSDLGDMSLNDVDNAFADGAGAYCPRQSIVSGTNETQELFISGSPTSGTFTLTYSGQTTALIDFDATAAEVDTALEALSNIGAGDVTCAGGPLPDTPIVVEFTGALAETNISEMTVDFNALLATATTTTQGNPGTNEQQQVALSNGNGGTFTLTFNGQTTAAISYNSSNATIDAALEALSNIGAGDITITGGPLPGTPIVVEFVNAMAETDQPQMTGPAPVNEVQVLTMTGTPTTGTVAVTFNGSATMFAFNESAAGAQTKLRNLASINGANVNVTGGPWPGAPLTVTFVGTLAGTNVPQMTTDNTTLQFTINTTTQGNPGANERQQIEINGEQAGTFTLTFSGQTTANLDYAAANSVIDAALEALSNIGAGDITITGGPLPGSPIVVEFGTAMANTNQPLLTATEAWQTNQTRFDSLDLPGGVMLHLKAIELQEILAHA